MYFCDKKNMKYTLILIVLLLTGTNAQAQKYIKLKKARIPYKQVPLDYSLMDRNKRFFIRYTEDELNPFKNKMELEGLVVLPGFEKAELVENSDFFIVIEEVKNRVVNYKATKNKKTSDAGVTYTYVSKGDLVSTFRIKLIDKVTDSLMFVNVSSSTINISSNVCSSASKAKEKYNEILEKNKSKNRKKGFSNTINEITDNYCYLDKTMFMNFAGIKFKKFDYTAINKIPEESMEVVSKKNTAETKAIVIGYIAVWEKELNNFVEGDKKARVNEKVKAALLFNIGLAHFYLGDFDKAKSFLDESFAFKFVVANRQADLYKAVMREIEHRR